MSLRRFENLLFVYFVMIAEAQRQRDIENLKRVANALDTAYRIPGTQIRFGWDGLIGLIPGVGDLLGFVPLVYYITLAIRHRLGFRICLILLLNQFADFLVGSIPLLGDIFDIAFKANVRNANALIERLKEESTD